MMTETLGKKIATVLATMSRIEGFDPDYVEINPKDFLELRMYTGNPGNDPWKVLTVPQLLPLKFGQLEVRSTETTPVGFLNPIKNKVTLGKVVQIEDLWCLITGNPTTRFSRVVNHDLLETSGAEHKAVMLRRSMTLQLPENAGPDRENAILDYVSQGHYEASFSTVTSTYNEHTAEFQVFSDALKIEGVRVNVTAETQQKIADMTGCLLLTPKLADLMWIQRTVKLNPHPRQITSSTAAMIEHSGKIDADLVSLGNPTGLLGTVGKHWVIDNDLLVKTGKAMNYGWHFEGASYQGIKGEAVASLAKGPNGQYLRLIQGRGTAHDMHHSDYSQVCVLVARSCRVDGEDMDLIALLSDPALAPLASHQGVLRVFRQPGVPDPGPQAIIMPEITITADRFSREPVV